VTSKVPGNMKPIRILVDSFADEGLTNAQMINAREIVSRLDSERFHVTLFKHGAPARQLVVRPNTRLIQLPRRLQTIPILTHFIFGRQEILFYPKPAPATRWYMNLRTLGRRRCALVATFESQSDWQDDTITPNTKKLIEETILRCDYLFSNSTNVQQSLETNYGLHTEVVPTGVDTTFFQPNWDRPANSRPRVLFVGALRSFKGPQVLLEAAERFPGADFILVGDGILVEELRTRGKHLANLEMCGSLNRIEIREKFALADIFMFPSRWEGSPRVLMEAAACGLPVLARKDYQPESVIDAKSGFLVGDDAEMMMRLEQLLSSPDLRRRLGECGRSHIARFDWNVITPQWEEIFTRIALARRESVQS
jgi:glycosyltransferase involved in cell wall biosynthesis